MFQNIDAQLYSWADRNNLQIQTLYRDEEVRSIELTNSKGTRGQIWVEINQDKIKVHAWDFGKNRLAIPATLTNVASALDAALSALRSWLN